MSADMTFRQAGGSGRRRAMPAADEGRWNTVETWVAIFAAFAVGLRQTAFSGVAVGDLVAYAMIPVWLPMLRRFRGGYLVFFGGLAAIVSGFFLSQVVEIDHEVIPSLVSYTSAQMFGVLCSIGLLLWTRTRLTTTSLAVAFAVGLIITGPFDTERFLENPWKFGLAVPVTIIVLALLQRVQSPWWTVVALLVLGGISSVNDARSSLAIMLLTAFLVGWRIAVAGTRAERSGWGVVAGLFGFGVVLYFALLAALQGGVLGEDLQERTRAQLAEGSTISLITNGRPEIGASTALFEYQPIGFGPGTIVNTADLSVAKTGLLELGYNPNNGYVNQYMFGGQIELHSVLFDLWAWFGLAGMFWVISLIVLIISGLGRALATAPGTAAIVTFIGVLTLWNAAFSPWFTSIPALILAIGLSLQDKEDTLGFPSRV